MSNTQLKARAGLDLLKSKSLEKRQEYDGILYFCLSHLKLRGKSTYNEKMKLNYQLDIPPHQITIMIPLNCSHFLYKIIFIYIPTASRWVRWHCTKHKWCKIKKSHYRKLVHYIRAFLIRKGKTRSNV